MLGGALPEMVNFGFPINRIGIYDTARLERFCIPDGIGTTLRIANT
jgi:hypothetical protein